MRSTGDYDLRCQVIKWNLKLTSKSVWIEFMSDRSDYAYFKKKLVIISFYWKLGQFYWSFFNDCLLRFQWVWWDLWQLCHKLTMKIIFNPSWAPLSEYYQMHYNSVRLYTTVQRTERLHGVAQTHYFLHCSWDSSKHLDRYLLTCTTNMLYSWLSTCSSTTPSLSPWWYFVHLIPYFLTVVEVLGP